MQQPEKHFQNEQLNCLGTKAGRHHPVWFCGLIGLAAVAGFLLSTANGFAASIIWGTPLTITGDTNVINSGTLVYAYTGGNAGATVNGVVFAAGNSGTTWGGNVSLSGFGSTSSAFSGGTNLPWTNLTSAYKTVLQGGAYGGATTGTVILKGLTAGRSYSVQIWVNDARSTGSGRSETANGANTVTLDYNSINAQGGVGQSVIGSFVANSTNQTFTLTSSSSVQLNAINLRDNGVYVYSPTRVNLAKYQPAVADSTNGSQNAAFITDGLVTDTSCWSSDNTGPHWAKVDFPFPVTVGSAQLVMGLDNVSPPTAFSLQYLTNGTWVNVPGATITGNTNRDMNIGFTGPVRATSFRFYDSADSTVYLREMALYPPNGTNGYPLGTDFSIDLARKQPTFATDNTFGGWPLLAADGLVAPSSAWQTTLAGSNSLLINLQFTNKIGSAHLYSGMTGVPPLSDFVLQYWDGAAWQNIPGGSVTGNADSALIIPFTTPVTTKKVQLVFTNNGTSAVQELCIFPANSSSGYPLGTGIVSNTPVTADYDTYSDSYYYLSNSATAKVVIESNGVPVMGAAGGTNWAGQYQVLLNYDNGTYRLINRDSGLCLAGAQLTTNAGGQLAEETYSALPDQEWFLQSIDGSSFYLMNQFSGLVADTHNGTLVQNVLTNSATQRWQISLAQIYPKKGIAGSSRSAQITFKSNWTYGWWYTSDPNVPGVNYFPMDPDSWYRGSTVAGNLWGFQRGWRTKGYALNIMGYNEPDHVDQANLDATNGAIYYMNDHCLDLPMAGPAAGNVNGSWNQTFFGYITNWGCRMDYLPAHEYPSNSSSASSSIWINPMQTAYNTYGIPMWMTEWSVVDWAGTGSWSEEDNYNALAEFLWRAESITWLRKYSLFVFTADTGSPMAVNPWTRTTPAPRSNSFDTNGALTPFGELYAAWDCDANVETNKIYYLHNSSTRKRMQNTLASTANAIEIRVNDTSTKWTLVPAGANLYYIVSQLDGRRLSYNGSSVGYVAAGTTGTAVQWALTANQYGWYYLDHPATSLRLQLAYNNSTAVATYSMVAQTTTSTAVQWRFIATLLPPAWTGFSENSWTNSGNWSSLQTPIGGQAVTFNSLSTSNLATTLNANFSLAGLSVTTPAGPVSVGGTNTLTLAGGGLDLSSANQNLTITAPLVLNANQTWNLANSRTLSVNGGVSDNGSGFNLTVAGGGKVSLGGAATHTGDTTVNAGGTLQMGAANVLPNGGGGGNMIVNGTLDLNGRAETINGLNGNGVVDNTAVGSATLTVGSNDATATFGGLLQDTGGALALVKTGSGDLTLTNANTHAGGTTLNGGLIFPKDNSSFGTGSLTLKSNTTVYATGGNYVFPNAVNVNGGTLRVGGGAGRSVTWNGLVNVTGDSSGTGSAVSGLSSDGTTSGQTFAGGVNFAGPYTFTSYANGTTHTLSAPITGSSGTLMATFGTLVLSATNTFGGSLRSMSGTLSIANAYAAQNATLDMNPADSGTLTLNNLNAVIGAITGSRNLNLGNGAVTIGNNNLSTAYSGALTNTASLTKVGSGTMTLSGVNTYSGRTTISGGTLALSGGGSLASTVISVASGARFDVSGLASAFVLGSARTLTNSSVGAVLNGTNDCKTGSLALLYNGVSPSLIQTNGTMLLSSSTVVKINNTGAPLRNGRYTIIAVTTTGNRGWVAGSLPPVQVTGNGTPGTAVLQINVAGGLDLVVTGATVTSVVISGGKLIFQGINGVASGTYSILTSTNVALPLANWTTNLTGTFSAGGAFSNAIPMTNNSKHFFLIKQP